MLQRAIEESKQDNGPNPDEMTYEQLLQMEEENGKVSKGLKPFAIRKIPEKTWNRLSDTSKKEEQCCICYDNFSKGQKIKELEKCKHAYHSKCINKWLENEKRCPVCNNDVI